MGPGAFFRFALIVGYSIRRFRRELRYLQKNVGPADGQAAATFGAGAPFQWGWRCEDQITADVCELLGEKCVNLLGDKIRMRDRQHVTAVRHEHQPRLW